jgi:2-iminobutanoate/2-iminopropanoate deaminase
MSNLFSPFYESQGFVFISGQVGDDAKTGVIPVDFEAQAVNAFSNLKLRLGEAGLTVAGVAKVSIFLTDLSYFEKMNELFADCFGDYKPARTTLGVAALPQFPGDPTVYIEIEAIAGN